MTDAKFGLRRSLSRNDKKLGRVAHFDDGISGRCRHVGALFFTGPAPERVLGDRHEIRV